jgi:hypothetical protein
MIPRAALTLSAAALLTCLSACVVNIDHTDDSCPAEQCATAGNYAGAIRAASTVSYSSDRSAVLNTVAAKPDIDEPSQIMLVNSLRGSWGYSSDKAGVLRTLVNNPALTSNASLHIANHLGQIVSYSSDRAAIAQLLASKPAAVSTESHGK